MNDVYSKFAVVIVAALIVTFMVSFAYKSIGQKDFDDMFPVLKGTKEALVSQIAERCEYCVGDATEDRDCFIMSLDLEAGEITPQDLNYSAVEIRLGSQITQGKSTYKMKSVAGRCEVVSFG